MFVRQSAWSLLNGVGKHKKHLAVIWLLIRVEDVIDKCFSDIPKFYNCIPGLKLFPDHHQIRVQKSIAGSCDFKPGVLS